MVAFAAHFDRSPRDKRKTIRRLHNVHGWVKSQRSFARRRCRIIDISSAGVRLSVDWSAQLTDTFNLILDGGAAAGHRLRIRWRRGNEIGAEFV
ncbi:MAG TPA: PilZ domain-containing protein [Xanthobacteraceae bacterium]|nr:PilZ domain-containing protein [Xanthobacteraceae bacterium]